MATNQTLQNLDDFEIMGDAPREDPVIAERRRARENEITKKLGGYLLKGYCMLGDSCQDCNCILLRSPEQKIFCVGCDEIDVQKATTPPVKKEETKKKSQTKKADRPATATTAATGSHSTQLENKLKWAVEELSKTQNTNRINEMCSVILKLTETIKALKQLEKN